MADELTIALTDTRVRKWGKLKIGLSDYGDAGVAIPSDPSTTAANRDEWFSSTTYKPLAFPEGVKELGYITTSGITDAKSMSSNNTQMLQSLIPVRRDLESIEKTLQGVFGESNAYTNALYHGLPVADWPASKDAAWAYSDGTNTEFPDYVLWLQGVDGVGTQAIFRYEIGYRVSVTAIENRVMNRSDPEGFGFTFGLFVDPVTGLSHSRVEDGPGYTTHLAYALSTAVPLVVSVLPSGEASGEMVVITGSRFTGTTGITIDTKTVLEFEVISDTKIAALIPAAVSGASDVVVTNAAGASSAFAYTAAGA